MGSSDVASIPAGLLLPPLVPEQRQLQPRKRKHSRLGSEMGAAVPANVQTAVLARASAELTDSLPEYGWQRIAVARSAPGSRVLRRRFFGAGRGPRAVCPSIVRH